MRLWTSLLAWAGALVLALLVAWPLLSAQPFPVPGYRNAVAGPLLTALAVAAALIALWASLFWEHARRHHWLFAAVAMACFLIAALFVSVPVGVGFAMLSVLVRSAA